MEELTDLGLRVEERNMTDSEKQPQRKLNKSEIAAYVVLDRLLGSMSPEGFNAVLILFGSSHGYLGGIYALVDILNTWNSRRKRKI